MLQAIITHRYDVMTRYMTSVQLYREEMGKPEGAGINPRKLRRLVLSTREEGLKAIVRNSSARSPQHAACHREHAGRAGGLWARSSASSERLLQQLQDWSIGAEQVASRSCRSSRVACTAVEPERSLGQPTGTRREAFFCFRRAFAMSRLILLNKPYGVLRQFFAEPGRPALKTISFSEPGMYMPQGA